MDLPYRAEYAKSNRSSCKGCKSQIGKDTLRLAVMVQSPMFDGKTPNWYHFSCFFSKQRPRTTDDIDHFETLRWEDQQKIKEKTDSAGSIVVPPAKGKKRDAASNISLKDYKIEYSKSSRATCRGCEQKIMKDEIRISKKDFDTEVGRKYGGQDMWHHVTCFAKLRSELGFYECGDKLPGFNSLSKTDQTEVKKQLVAIKQEEVPIKKPKTEDTVDGEASLDKEIQKQNKIIYKYRDQLKKHLTKSELQLLLEENDQDIPTGEERMLDRLSDIMTFGALQRCGVCKDGQFVFNKMGYTCQGNLTEWSKCSTVVKEPVRRQFTVPAKLAGEHTFLKKYKYVPRVRVIKDVCPTNSNNLVKKGVDETDDKPKVEREKPPLYNMEIVILGNPPRGKDALKKQITTLGGKVVTKIRSTVMVVIATEADVEKMGSRISEAQREDVHVVSEDFLDEAKEYAGRIPELVIKKSICSWGSDPNNRLPAESSTSLKSKSKSIYTSSVPSKLKIKLKEGSAIDPDSGLEDRAHVYQSRDDKYTATLGITDIQRQKNSFYKIQLLEADVGNRYWVFRAWGRIGTTIGGNKLEDMSTLVAAKHHFCALYEEKSGNTWEDRHNFVKVPGRLYPIDVDYGEEDASLQINDDVPSNLPVPVQDLIKMIFDINSMKKLMLEFEIDTEKMPLGKLSKKQIQSAYGVLTEMQQLIDSEGEMVRFIDASNRFYTLIPHSFGVDDPPVITDSEVVKQKIDMLDNLMEIEIAYSLMKISGSDSGIDQHYQQLKTDIELLERTSEEFNIIQEYVKNTHASTHSHYELEIHEVFKVTRHGEEKRYKPFRKLHNRKLLWHGSRRTNFAGILSQGLRIAPPEAPVTGYMFGKGIYFADMVSKSANYCCTNSVDSTGLMLLCEVALGEMYERTNAHYIEKLPKGKHSCKGVGRTHPDPATVKKIEDVEVPLGTPVTIQENTSLLYNEFIVYDVAQVNVKYLLQMNFKYKY